MKPGELVGRALIAAACLVALAVVGLAGCESEQVGQARQIAACGEMCGAKGVRKFSIGFVAYVGSVPVCECNPPTTPADGGTAR